ncbi:hypothetical protein PM10SUCC1_25250 [Propionigenium maris DSM 9537]|uniref:Uncharacterized protein n=1 Tax=Propionigenium maris DSM 9537 TaxID=1123000 RepID=A0A9W6GNH6_9FUSO|nr:hypothetical protein [Propionigenium maris]GLI57011.1 hypothetical protein PM10SUCC1_25250 [Propionigenium maris DSM 9537]
MNKHYYISSEGKITKSIIFGEPYISINCGSVLDFSPAKVKELLSKNTSYNIDLIEESIAEIHHNRDIFFIREDNTIKNTPSEISLEDFLCSIK